jgi:UDP-N-acetylmuramoyl-tripeptide--D-alanyl-D-alanine ligase
MKGKSLRSALLVLMKLTVDQIIQATQGKILRKHQDAFDTFSIDSRKMAEGGLFFALKGENTDGHLFLQDAFRNGAGGAIVENQTKKFPDKTLILVQDSMKAIRDLAAFVRDQSSSKYIGITGSSGKTSTKEFTASLLSQNYDVYKSEGNLNSLTGLPLSLLSMEQKECAVFEVAMNRPGEIGRLSEVLKPDIGVVLNVNPVHALQFPSIEAIADEKASLVKGMADESILIYNADDSLLDERLHQRARKYTYGLSRKVDLRITDIRMRGVRGGHAVLRSEGKQIFVETGLCGIGNLYNIAAAAAVALQLHLSVDEIAQGISKLKPYNQRGILIEKDSLHIYDDTYNSNPRALEMVLNLVGDSAGYARKIAVLGDMLELGEGEEQFHASAGDQVATNEFTILIAVGALSKFMAETAQKKGVEVYTVETSEEAAEKAAHLVKEGDLVLVKGSRGMQMEKVVSRLAASQGKVESEK